MRHKLLILLGAVLLVSTYWLRNTAFDIQLYDTYFVIGWSTIIGTIGLLCFLVGVAGSIVSLVRAR